MTPSLSKRMHPVNIVISAFLCFSGRLLYPSYALVERPLGIDPLTDRIAAGAFMWVFGSLVFVAPATFLTLRVLSNGRLVSAPDIYLDRFRSEQVEGPRGMASRPYRHIPFAGYRMAVEVELWRAGMS
jgi:Cytochrome c oxidase caa3 assembly factor (Caa3_CtaG)